MTWIVETFPVGPLQCNCTIVGDSVSKKAMVVDPGGDLEQIMEVLQRHDLQVQLILHTHAHFDHFLASGMLQEKTEAPLALHQADLNLWQRLELQCQMFGMPYVPVPEPTHWLEHEEELCFGSCQGHALHTPGHSPGSMSFVFNEQKLVIAGDTLFKGGIGRTDLWGGDFPTIEQSIKKQLYSIDGNFTVVTGHGPSTTIEAEMRSNPYIRPDRKTFV